MEATRAAARDVRIASRLALWVGLAVLASPATARQDAAKPASTPAVPAPAPVPIAPGDKTGEPPAPQEAMAAYTVLDGWVREGVVKDSADVKAFPAVAVTLRLAGVVVGRGTDLSGGPGGLANAARAALEEAAQRMPVENDALREENLRAARRRLAISLELAGALVPYRPATYAQADLEVQVGLEGIAARKGDQIFAIFPGAMLANNTTPGDALASVISQATGDPQLAIRALATAQPAKLAQDHALTLYWFRETQLAQPATGEPPIFLFRGGHLVSRSESDASLQQFADGLARHLLARKWPGKEPLGMLGTARPVQGDYEPLVATPMEQALVALALQRYVKLKTTPPETARSCNEFIDGLLTALAPAEADAQKPMDMPVAALCLVAVGPGFPGDDRPLPVHIARLQTASLRAILDAADHPQTVPAPFRAMLAWALAEEAAASHDQAEADRADDYLRGVLRKTSPAQLPSEMPWLGWAELALTRARGDLEIKSAPALRDMRDQLWKHQLTPDDCGPESPDLVGGIVFTSARTPLPTWQCLRPLVFTASMLGQPRLTDDAELPRELARLLSSLRFVRQLAADEAAGHMYQDPARALWGIRSALWDQRQPPEASALALLMTCEMLESLEKRSPQKK